MLRIDRSAPRCGWTSLWPPAASLLACSILLAASGCSEGITPTNEPSATHQPASGPRFSEVATSAGLDFIHVNGASGEYNYPELMHAGCAFVDYDGDGLLDIYLVQSGELPVNPDGANAANQLFRNLGNGRFARVTDQARAGDRGYGTGVAAADYDGDGNVDLYITNLGANTLLRNRGDGTFEDLTLKAGVGHPGYGAAAAFVDLDADGDLDLFVVNYLEWSPAIERPCFSRGGLQGYCSPGVYERPQADVLYRNNGDGTFTDISLAAGITGNPGTGLGIVTGDLDGDGREDVYVANDQMPNHLWINQGGNRFRDEALVRGVAVNEVGSPEAGMGVFREDLEADGDWDFFVTHLTGETNTFYRGLGGTWEDATDSLGLGAVSRPFTGFGTGLVDFDGDGWLDIFVANGKVRLGDDMQPEYGEPNQLLRGTPSGKFADWSALAGEAFLIEETSRGAAFGDYDNDGDIDILVANNNGPVRLLRNETERRATTVEVVAGVGRTSFGTVLVARSGEVTRRAGVQPAWSYASSNDPRLHFQLPGPTTDLEVRPPGGTPRHYLGVPTEDVLIIQEN